MEIAVIPRWIVSVIGVMYRFVAGGFGVSLPRPYKTTMCAPFWIALVGCTVALPVVLLAWGVRLTLGKGRARRIFGAINDFMGRRIANVIGNCLLILVLICMIIFAFFVFIREYGWWGSVILILGIPAVILVMIVTVVSLAPKTPKVREFGDGYGQGKKQGRAFGKVSVFFSVLIFLPKILLIGLWQVLAFLGLMIIALYKKFCPLVEFP